MRRIQIWHARRNESALDRRIADMLVSQAGHVSADCLRVAMLFFYGRRHRRFFMSGDTATDHPLRLIADLATMLENFEEGADDMDLVSGDEPGSLFLKVEQSKSPLDLASLRIHRMVGSEPNYAVHWI